MIPIVLIVFRVPSRPRERIIDRGCRQISPDALASCPFEVYARPTLGGILQMAGDSLRRLLQLDRPSVATSGDRPVFVYAWDRPGKGGFQPIACRGITGYLFVLQADRNDLQALLDRCLNVPAGGKVRYVALSDLVLLTFDRTQKLLPTTPRFRSLGWTPETEASIWIVAGRTKPGPSGTQILERMVFYVPYIFVEEWPAIWGGRAVYGFPKELAWLEIPQGPPVTSQLAADVVGTEKFAVDAEWTRLRLLEVNPTSASGHPVMLDLDTIIGVLRNVVQQAIVPGLGLVKELFDEVEKHEFPLVFLQQVVDGADGTFAAYQAIIEAPLRIDTVREIRVLSQPFQLTIHTLDSHPLAQVLGLQSPQTVRRAYWVDLDFDIENATTVCESCWTGL